jgi:nucleoside-diphosphate-sugar epimerase
MAKLYRGLLQTDLEEVISGVGEDWGKFRDSTLLVLGGTGFVGSWLVSSLLYADTAFQLNLSIVLVTRDVNATNIKLSLSKDDPVILVRADLQKPFEYNFPNADFYIHAATPSVLSTGLSNPGALGESTINGAVLISKLMNRNQSESTFLHTSSGAVYGPQSLNLDMRLESHALPENSLLTSYAKSKIETEKYFLRTSENGLIQGSNPRLFSFFGPRLALEEHFAIGNFINDGLKDSTIKIKGNPGTTRSYLYPTDLTIWLVKLLINPHVGPLNIGSDASYSMLELGTLISGMTSQKGVELLNPNIQSSRYVPSIEKIKEHLNVVPSVSISDGIERWMTWLQMTQK